MSNEAPQVDISPIAMLAAIMFAARHEVYVQVEPGVKKPAKRIMLEVNPDEGTAVAVLDPALLLHFAQVRYSFQFDEIIIPGALAPNNQALRLSFRQAGKTGILGPNGRPVPGRDEAAIALLKLVLG